MRNLTLVSYDFHTYDLENFKRKVWDLMTFDDLEMFLLWNQSVLSEKKWNKLMDYMLKNIIPNKNMPGGADLIESYKHETI